MFEPMPFERKKHIYRCDEFSELLKDAVRFFHGTPICALPPEEKFDGSGIYSLYYIGKTGGGYSRFGLEINREEYRLPIYVGKAEPTGWRQGRKTSPSKSRLYDRLRQHSRSIQSAKNLNLSDFVCRLMIFEDPVEAMIASVEASLIAMHRPLWNSIVDGFGNHNPGQHRFHGKMTLWDALHPGRAWAKKMSGEVPDVAVLNRRVKDYLAGIQ